MQREFLNTTFQGETPIFLMTPPKIEDDTLYTHQDVGGYLGNKLGTAIKNWGMSDEEIKARDKAQADAARRAREQAAKDSENETLLGGLWNGLKEIGKDIASIGSAIVSGAKSFGNWIAKGASAISDFFTSDSEGLTKEQKLSIAGMAGMNEIFKEEAQEAYLKNAIDEMSQKGGTKVSYDIKYILAKELGIKPSECQNRILDGTGCKDMNEVSQMLRDGSLNVSHIIEAVGGDNAENLGNLANAYADISGKRVDRNNYLAQQRALEEQQQKQAMLALDTLNTFTNNFLQGQSSDYEYEFANNRSQKDSDLINAFGDNFANATEAEKDAYRQILFQKDRLAGYANNVRSQYSDEESKLAVDHIELFHRRKDFITSNYGKEGWNEWVEGSNSGTIDALLSAPSRIIQDLLPISNVGISDLDYKMGTLRSEGKSELYQNGYANNFQMMSDTVSDGFLMASIPFMITNISNAGQVADDVAKQTSNNSLYRRSQNVGEFSDLTEPMQLKHVRNIANESGIGYDGVKLRIIRDPELINKNIYGYTHPSGKRVDLYPDAFSSREQLIKTLGHERTHVYQVQTLGAPQSTKTLQMYEKGAAATEDSWWKYYLSK